MKHLTFLLLLISFPSFAEIKGTIKDEAGYAVSFTNVYIENIGLTTTTGRFSFPDETEGQMLVIYACGFEIKKVIAEKNNDIVLTSIERKEVSKAFIPKNNIAIEHGKVEVNIEKSAIYNPDMYCTMIAKYFPEAGGKNKKRYIKSVNISFLHLMYSDIESQDPRIRIRLFGTNKDGSPGTEIYYEDVLVSVAKRKLSKSFEKYVIEFPENGIFVAVEWIKIPVNMRNLADESAQEVLTPPIIIVPSENPSWQFSHEWSATSRTEKNKKNPFSNKFGEPAISITLTD